MKKDWAEIAASGCLVLLMVYAGVMFSWIIAWFLSPELRQPWQDSEDILEALWHVNLPTFAPIFGVVALVLTGLVYFGIRLYDGRNSHASRQAKLPENKS